MAASRLMILFMTVFIDLLGFGIVIPFLTLYAQSLGATPAVATLLGTLYALVQLFFAPVWGRLSDRIGRRPVILATILGSCIAYLLLGLATSIGMLFVSRLLAGVAGANISTAQAYVADSTSPKERAKGMGLIGAAFGLGFVFGPPIGGILSHVSYSLPGLVTAGMSLVNFALAFFLLPEPVRQPEAHPGTARRPGLRGALEALSLPGLGLLLAILFMARFAFSTFEWTLPLLLKNTRGYTESQIGYLFGYVGVLIVITQGGLVGRLVRALGERRLVLIGTLAMAIGLGLIPFAGTVPALCLVLALLAFGQGLNSPSLASLISQTADPAHHGQILGISQSPSSLAMILGPAWGGFTFGHVAPGAPYLTAGLFMAVAFGLSLRLAFHTPVPIRGAPSRGA